MAALITTEGPAGVSRFHENDRPDNTAATPNSEDRIAICSGVRENLRAAAAGIIISEVIKSAPTNFIPTAMTTPTSNIKTRRIKSVLIPSILASSSLTLLDSRGCQKYISAAIMKAPPANMKVKSLSHINI